MAQGSYEKRGNMWTVRYRDTAGRNRRESGFRTKSDAKTWFDTRMREQKLGIKHDRGVTLRKFVDDIYLEKHDVSASRRSKLQFMANIWHREFGDTPLEDLTTEALQEYAKKLSDTTRHDAVAALRQFLNAAVRWKYLVESPARDLKNPEPVRDEIIPFASWAEVEALEAEMPEHYRGLATIVVATGLRPQEWTKLRWEHVDFEARCLVLPKSVVKKRTPARRVPLQHRALWALQERRQASGFVFTTLGGGPIDIRNFRSRIWGPAQDRLGGRRRRPYDMRHTYATWYLRDMIGSTFNLSRRMGTSLLMIEKTYGHLASDSEATELDRMDRLHAPESKPLRVITVKPAGHVMGTAGTVYASSVPT